MTETRVVLGATPDVDGGPALPRDRPPTAPDYFRFGASTLTNDILRQLARLKTGTYMAGYDFAEV